MTISPVDAYSYAAQLRADLAALTKAVERIANALELLANGDCSVSVRQAGPWTTREDRP